MPSGPSTALVDHGAGFVKSRGVRLRAAAAACLPAHLLWCEEAAEVRLRTSAGAVGYLYLVRRAIILSMGAGHARA